MATVKKFNELGEKVLIHNARIKEGTGKYGKFYSIFWDGNVTFVNESTIAYPELNFVLKDLYLDKLTFDIEFEATTPGFMLGTWVGIHLTRIWKIDDKKVEIDWLNDYIDYMNDKYGLIGGYD